MLCFVAPLPPPMTDDTPDGDIAQRIAGGGPDAAAAESALCRKFAGRIRLYGKRHLRDDQSAQDLVQLVLVRVLEALRSGRVENPESIGSFVLGACRNVTFDLRRSERRQRAIESAALAVHAVAAPLAMSEHDVQRLFLCMRQLPARDHQVIRMTFMEDRDTDEVARRMGLTEGNVRVVRHRALAKLHDCMENGGGS
jgi:RNA polymerase sigma-70 factor (ECF subfamily)